MINVYPFLIALLAAILVIFLAILFDTFLQGKKSRELVREIRRIGDASSPEDSAGSILKNQGEEGIFVRFFTYIPSLERLKLGSEQAGLNWSRSKLIRIIIICALLIFIVVLLLSKSFLLSLALVPFAILAPQIQISRNRKKRLRLFEEMLPEAIDLLARALRAGSPLSAGLKMVSEDMPEPLTSEFRRIFDEQKHGLPLQESLQGLVDRIPLLDVRIFVTAVLVQREVGGNLSEILEKISKTIRERFIIRRQVDVYTAQGRMTGYLLSGLPLAVGAVLNFMNPGYVSILFQEPVGRLLVGIALFLQITGFLIIKKIVNIDI